MSNGAGEQEAGRMNGAASVMIEGRGDIRVAGGYQERIRCEDCGFIGLWHAVPSGNGRFPQGWARARGIAEHLSSERHRRPR